MNTGRNHNLHLQQIWSNEPRLQGMCRSHGFFRVNRRTVLPEKSRKRFESPRSAEPVDLAEPSRKPINCRGTLETSMLAPMPQTNRPTALPNSREAARPPRSARLANWLGTGGVSLQFGMPYQLRSDRAIATNHRFARGGKLYTTVTTGPHQSAPYMASI